MTAPKDNDFAKGNSGGGAPEGNQNARQHGVYSDPAKLLPTLSGGAREFVDTQYDGYLELAPFGSDDPRAERLLMICVMQYQEWVAHSQIHKDGMSVWTPTGETTPGGREIQKRRAHPLLKEAHRLNSDIRQGLKALGLLPPRGRP